MLPMKFNNTHKRLTEHTWFKTPNVFNFAASPHNSVSTCLEINSSGGLSVSSSSASKQKVNVICN